MSLTLTWEKFTHENLDAALGHSYCLYAFHHPLDGDRPFYIGKAKLFGTKQASGYSRSARYNSGYVHLIAGMLRSGYSLYIAPIGESAFVDVEAYEQELISRWNPIRKQRIKLSRKTVVTDTPWGGS